MSSPHGTLEHNHDRVIAASEGYVAAAEAVTPVTPGKVVAAASAIDLAYWDKPEVRRIEIPVVLLANSATAPVTVIVVALVVVVIVVRRCHGWQ